MLAAPLISVQIVPFGLDCHCKVHVPVPPVWVAFSVIEPPTQMTGAFVVIDTEGSATTIMVLAALVTSQPEVDCVTTTRKSEFAVRTGVVKEAALVPTFVQTPEMSRCH